MKKLLFILFVFSSVYSDAQWYTRRFGVANITELNKDQLNFALDRADRTRRTGMTLTIVGVSAIAGGLTTMAGIPVWIVGKSRKNTINFQLARFNDTSYIPSIGIRISF